MLTAIGIDAVEIVRFEPWIAYSRRRLTRVFSQEEISYAFSCPAKSAERLAARFAAKEALFKALSQAGYKVPFLRLCAYSSIVMGQSGPIFQVHWQALGFPEQRLLVSITHTDSIAIAFVALDRENS